MRDLRYALRTLSRNPGFTISAMLVLALGIGANSAIFTVVRAVLLAPLPYRDPARLVNLYERNVVGETSFNVVSAPNFYDWQSQSHSFEQMAFYTQSTSSFTPGDGGLPENLSGALCSYNLFSTLGVEPQLGRAFLPSEDAPGAARVAIISDSLWRRRFGASRDVIGMKTRLDEESHTIVGVMPPGFDYPTTDTQIWLPVWRNVNENAKTMRGNHRFSPIARLKKGVSVEQARTELDGIARRIRQQYPDTLTGQGANVVQMQERMVARVKPMLLVLLGAVACVLLIACVNVTNLLLARAVGRRREVAVRVALGARRSQILKQFLAESLLISLGGAALGLFLAVFGTDLLIRMAGYIPRIETVRVNATVLMFTAAVAVLTGILVGLAPAFSSWRAGVRGAMQEGGRSATAGRERGVFRDTLIAVEVALSLMLLIGAGLMFKSLARLRAVDPGFVPDRILTIRFSLPRTRYKAAPQVAAFYRDVLQSVRALPGVESAGLITVPPLGGHYMDNSFTIDGHAPLPKGQFLVAVVRWADPDYFKAMGIPLKRGHFFTGAEWLDSANKAVITESMAAAFFPNEDPIGKRIRTSDTDAYEIVGIVGDTRQSLASAPEPMMYFPLYKGDYIFATLLFRAAGDPNLLSLPVQKEMRNLDADLPAVTVKTMDEVMSGATEQNRFGLSLIAVFAALAVVLASIGLYGVLAYSVGQRTNELGVRIALGAGPGDITQLVVWQGLKPAALGIAAGLIGGVAATRLLQSLLYEVSPNDPLVITVVALLLVVISIAASVIPAWRATRIDPVMALRAE
jgi:predicted permease